MKDESIWSELRLKGLGCLGGGGQQGESLGVYSSSLTKQGFRSQG